MEAQSAIRQLSLYGNFPPNGTELHGLGLPADQLTTVMFVEGEIRKFDSGYVFFSMLYIHVVLVHILIFIRLCIYIHHDIYICKKI